VSTHCPSAQACIHATSSLEERDRLVTATLSQRLNDLDITIVRIAFDDHRIAPRRISHSTLPLGLRLNMLLLDIPSSVVLHIVSSHDILILLRKV
jgi:hypothetical protein